mgnify:CR=1 FL=1
MCPYRSMSRNHLYYYTSWPHWVLNIDTFSVELITKSTLTIRTHCLATSSLFRGTLGRFIIICGPFQSYPNPIPAFHLSTGTLWNPFLHFRFIDQHASSYSIKWMVEWGQSMKSDCSVKRFLQTKGRRTNSLRFVTPSNQHHCFTFQNTIVFDSPIQMPTHPMIHSFIACRILENGVGMIHWDSLSFRWSFEMGCVWPFWILQHLDNSVVDSIDSMMISFLWSEWGVEWVCQMLWHCGSEG